MKNNEVVKFGLILFVITAVCTGIVSAMFEITNPIKIPNITTFMILSNLAKKSPIIEPILEIERSTPDRKIESPMMTPKNPRTNFISKSLANPTKKLRIKTKKLWAKLP